MAWQSLEARMKKSVRGLYPQISARSSGWLDVSDGHRVYWEECGNPAGIPAIFLHGGPGAGSAPAHRRFFDPERTRIILMDQRGAGRSKPTASIEGNTTQALIEDIETLRRHLSIDRWLVFGGSWGSTLALAYGEAHPQSCLGFVLRGIFLGTMAEVEWFLYGMGRFFPEAQQRFLEPIPVAERADLLGAYWRRLIDEDPRVHLPAARAWSRYERSCSTLLPNGSGGDEDDGFHLSLARMEAHYFRNELFLRDGQLLAELDRISHLPATIVQGRYDVICPPEAARRLADAWPGATLEVVADAGHSAMETGIRAGLVAATDRLLTRI